MVPKLKQLQQLKFGALTPTSNPILCELYTASNPILCVANQAHHPNYLALQSEPVTATQLPQLASNSNTLHNLWHI